MIDDVISFPSVLVQDCSNSTNSSAFAMELLQPCTMLWILLSYFAKLANHEEMRSCLKFYAFWNLASFMLGVHWCTTNLETTYELSNSGFLQLMNSHETFAIKSLASIYNDGMGMTNMQVKNGRIGCESDLGLHHNGLKSSWPSHVIVRRAGLLWSQEDFEWRWSVPLFKCLTVLEFSFILFDLCLLITFFNFIMNYVPIVTFWIFTYHKIWILSIMFCSIWSYWIIYFLACLEVSWRVVS